MHSNLHFKNQNYLLAREGYLKVINLLITFNKAVEYFKVENDKFSSLLSLSSLDAVITECYLNIAICSYLVKDYRNILIYTEYV
jgi:hypothetical protein